MTTAAWARRLRAAGLWLVPLSGHLRSAGRGAWADDLIAGSITAVLLVPQAMAYALLAGLPPQLGLYAAVVPPLIYAFIGTSRALAVGPVAVAALMTANALSDFGGGDRALWVNGAVILAAETGLILLLFGVCRLGWLVSFISHPVLSGFTSGAAVLIIASQIPHLTGIDIARGGALDMLWALTPRLNQFDGSTLAFGLGAIALLLLGRTPLVWALERAGLGARAARLSSRAAPLAVVVLATAVAWGQGGDQAVSVVGAIPAGLPGLSLDFLGLAGWRALLPSALLIAVVGYVESISVAKVLAARRRQKIDANRELIALGAANVSAAVAGTMPVSGGFSRSTVNFDAGAQTQLAGIVTAVLVAAVALFFTGWFYFLPQAALAAIIVVAVAQLIDARGAWAVWRYDQADAGALLATFVAVLIFGIDTGLVAGIGLSVALYLWRTSQPHLAVVGRVPETEHFRNINRHVVQTDDRVLSVRIDADLYFANAAHIETYVIRHLAAAPEARNLLLVMTAVSYIDASGLEMLEHLERDLAQAGVALHLAEVKGPVADRLRGTALWRRLARRTYLTTDQAFNTITQGECHAARGRAQAR